VSNLSGSRKITESKQPTENIIIPSFRKLNQGYYNLPSFKIEKPGEKIVISDVIFNF